MIKAAKTFEEGKRYIFSAELYPDPQCKFARENDGKHVLFFANGPSLGGIKPKSEWCYEEGLRLPERLGVPSGDGPPYDLYEAVNVIISYLKMREDKS